MIGPIILLLDKCYSTRVLHTTHPKNDKGEYFFFDDNQFSSMVGSTNWNAKDFDILQKGSRTWKGTIRVWNGKNGGLSAHGRRQKGQADNQWSTGDTIEMKVCKSR